MDIGSRFSQSYIIYSISNYRIFIYIAEKIMDLQWKV